MTLREELDKLILDIDQLKLISRENPNQLIESRTIARATADRLLAEFAAAIRVNKNAYGDNVDGARLGIGILVCRRRLLGPRDELEVCVFVSQALSRAAKAKRRALRTYQPTIEPAT